MKREREKSDISHISDKQIRMVRIGMLAAGLGLVIFGISQGDFSDVMNKAIRICYECIGIG